MRLATFLLIFYSFSLALDTSKILQELNSITDREKKELLDSEIDSSYNPFDPAKLGVIDISSEDNSSVIVTIPSEPTKLQAIFDNNRVKIDGAWYESNQSIGDYIIDEIGKNSVVLKNGDKIKKLFIFEKNIVKVK